MTRPTLFDRPPALRAFDDGARVVGCRWLRDPLRAHVQDFLPLTHTCYPHLPIASPRPRWQAIMAAPVMQEYDRQVREILEGLCGG